MPTISMFYGIIISGLICTAMNYWQIGSWPKKALIPSVLNRSSEGGCDVA